MRMKSPRGAAATPRDRGIVVQPRGQGLPRLVLQPAPRLRVLALALSEVDRVPVPLLHVAQVEDGARRGPRVARAAVERPDVEQHDGAHRRRESGDPRRRRSGEDLGEPPLLVVQIDLRVGRGMFTGQISTFISTN